MKKATSVKLYFPVQLYQVMKKKSHFRQATHVEPGRAVWGRAEGGKPWC